MVFYLKYRPKKINELDSLSIQERLSSALKGKLPDDIAHAFLFTGPKGLGKTSTARIVAKAINCTNRRGAEIEPCNKCSSCKSIDVGSSLDVIEIDGASNRGIDEIRDLREKIKLSPVNSLKKIYIIDEVHMLTTEAFNALLKTLEEPPKHAQFILCTTEPQKIPDTISSRCFNIRFTRATDEDLIHSFKRIIKGEGIEADKEALTQIATLSDGSFRDGAKILEEVSAGNKKITTRLIEKKYNYGNVNKSISELILALKKKDSKRSIRIITDLEAESTDFKYFTEQFVNALHKKLIEELENGAEDSGETKELILVIIKAYSEIKFSILPQLPLELAVVEWCSQGEVSGIKYQVSSEAEINSDFKREEKDIKDSNSQPTKTTSSSGLHASKHDNILESLIENVGKDNFSIAGVLRGCAIKSFDNKSLVLSTEYKFHKERLSDKKVIDMLENKLKEIIGKEINVEIVMKS